MSSVQRRIFFCLLFFCSSSVGADCSTREFSVHEQEVQKAYIGYYGRPADTGGLDFWSQQLAGAGGDLSAIIEAFGDSQEFVDEFGGLTNEQLVTNLYRQLFGRDPDPEGLAFYLGSLDAGIRSLQSIALDILNGARNQDAILITNKLSVSNHILTELEAAGLGYLDGTAQLLAGVTDDPATATAACAGVDSLLATAVFDLAGTAFAAQLNLTDSDVNDPNAFYRANDGFATAQAIPSIALVGGYCNRPGFGDPGRSFLAGDVHDSYLVQLEAGKGIQLRFEDPSFDDLDLWLFDEAQDLVDSSQGVGAEEFLIAPASGTYYILVEAYAGASTYSLAVGTTDISRQAIADSLHMSSEFVTGQAIVRFTERARAQAKGDLARLLQAVRLRRLAGAAGRALLTGLADRPQGIRATARSAADDTPPHYMNTLTDEQLDKLDTLRAIKALRRRAEVRYADPNYLLHASAVPNDSFYGFQWHYPLINLEEAWEQETGSPETIVAVIDTGVLLDHPDLQGQLTAGYDFIRNPRVANDGDGIDPDPDDPGDSATPGGSSSFHGTHVTGTVAAASDNDTGVAGVAWNTRVMPLRVLGVGGGESYDVRQGVRYAAGLANDSGTLPARPATIINLSLGGGGYSSSDQDLYRQVRAAGIITIAAAGNESSSQPHYPSGYDGVVSVSAVGPSKVLAPYSNFGSRTDVAAPGGDISMDLDGDGYADGVLSTAAGDATGVLQFGYYFYQGTSMAAPHVAGVAALMKSAHPGLTPDDFDALLASQAIVDDLGMLGWDSSYGHGLINANKAVLAAQELAGTPPQSMPRLSAAPTSLNFALTQTSTELVLSNRGEGPLTVDFPPQVTAPWLSVTPLEVDDDDLGRYRVSLDRSGLAAGLYSAQILFTSSANSVSIQVSMEVTALAYEPDVGYLYLLLYDPEELVTIEEAQSAGDTGAYGFSFSDTKPGQYWIIAGSDLDNDGFICDSGESCGVYPTGSLPENIVVDRDLRGLDFVTAFEGSITPLDLLGLQGRAGKGFRRVSHPR